MRIKAFVLFSSWQPPRLDQLVDESTTLRGWGWEEWLFVAFGILILAAFFITRFQNPRAFIKSMCGLCGGGIEFPAQGLGSLIKCPHCNEVVELKRRTIRLFLFGTRDWFESLRIKWKWVCAIAVCALVAGATFWIYADIKATAIAQAAKLLESQNQTAFEVQQAELARQELLRQQVVVAERARKDAVLSALQQKHDSDELKSKLEEANMLAKQAERNRWIEAVQQQQALDKANRLAQTADLNRQEEAARLKQEIEQANWDRQQEAFRQQQALEKANRIAQDAAWQQQIDSFNQQQTLRRIEIQNNNYVRPIGVPSNARLIRSGSGYVWVW